MLQIAGLRVWRDGVLRLGGDHGLDLTLAAGESVAILGPSGAGKSTLLQALLGLLERSAHVEHRAFVFGDAPITPRLRGRAIGLLPQDALGSLDPLQRVHSAMREQARIHGVAAARGDALLREVGLQPEVLADRRPHQLSGGQRQRLALALALLSSPPLLLLDEPASALDGDRARAIASLLRSLRTRHALTLLTVSHDPAFAAAVADRTLRLDVAGGLEPA